MLVVGGGEDDGRPGDRRIGAEGAQQPRRPVIPGMWMSMRRSAGAELRGSAASALTPSAGGADQLEHAASAFTQRAQRFARERFVFGNEGPVAHGLGSSIVPGAGSFARSQPMGMRISTRKPATRRGTARRAAREPSKSSSKRRRSALNPTPPTCWQRAGVGHLQPAPSSRDRQREDIGVGRGALRLDTEDRAALRSAAAMPWTDAVLDQRLQRQRRDRIAGASPGRCGQSTFRRSAETQRLSSAR